MKTFPWLLRRELWEHKGSFLWAPLVMAAALVLLVSLPGAHFSVTVNGSDAAQAAQRAVMTLSASFLGASLPLFGMLAFVSLFYCIGALYDDRRDRSILFWKSLPVSDGETVVSKLVMVLVVGPLLTIAIAIATSFVVLLIVGGVLAAKGTPVLGAMLATPAPYVAPLLLVGLWPVYVVWALPSVGWLLMVSSWARSKAFMWAVGVPVLAMIVVKWLKLFIGPEWQGDWLVRHVFARALAGLVPGNWFLFNQGATFHRALPDGSAAPPFAEIGNLFADSWATLAAPGVWVAAAIGVAMIFTAIRLRRTRSEA
ncbi:MAG: hypothetical protein JSR18_02690 [Proteobacteria bacterium]|nr:hypothetical protein [Pseudomonadota bacterium]